MENKINIAELLKDCPSGMELNCAIYENLYFDSLNADYYGTINCYTLIDGIKTSINFTKYGTFNNHLGAKCVIFPKGKTTWEGYKWNTETKTLEKLIQPKFKVGDRIMKRGSIKNWIVSSVSSEYYGLKLPKGIESIGVLPVVEQDNWELVPNKFDITTLKPFDKVLVRDFDNTPWEIEWFSRLLDGKHFKCFELSYVQCIPYEGNEHLLGKRDDCDEYYKTW